MTQKMLGYISDLITITGLVYMILLIHGFVRLKPDQQEKFDEVLESRGTWLKILVYGAAAIFTGHFILKFLSR
jgi:hypothetical protein